MNWLTFDFVKDREGFLFVYLIKAPFVLCDSCRRLGAQSWKHVEFLRSLLASCATLNRRKKPLNIMVALNPTTNEPQGHCTRFAYSICVILFPNFKGNTQTFQTPDHFHGITFGLHVGLDLFILRQHP